MLSNYDAYKEIGRRLRVARLNTDLSQSELAKLAGISESTVKRAETASGNITLTALIAILRALRKIDQLDLFLPAPPPNPAQLVASKGKSKQRASKTNRQTSSTTYPVSKSNDGADRNIKNSEIEDSAKPFSWGDD